MYLTAVKTYMTTLAKVAKRENSQIPATLHTHTPNNRQMLHVSFTQQNDRNSLTMHIVKTVKSYMTDAILCFTSSNIETVLHG